MQQKRYLIGALFLLVFGAVVAIFILSSNKFSSEEADTLTLLERDNWEKADLEPEEKNPNIDNIEWSHPLQGESTTHTWTLFSAMSITTWGQKKIKMITQYRFSNNNAKIKALWALDDHGIAKAVWFYATFWDYFDGERGNLPSMVSCEDVETERLKQALRWWKCKWHEINYPPFSFVVMAQNPLLFIEEWKIFIKDQARKEDKLYEITQYDIDKDTTLKEIIDQSKDWLSDKYCLKKHYFWSAFKDWNTTWNAGLWEKLNKLYNEGKLQIYDIHEMFDGQCLNNDPWLLFYQKWSTKFYTVIGQVPWSEFPTYDGIYSTPFSVDIQ